MSGVEPVAWAWVAHLRRGGSTPWLAFAAEEHPPLRGATGDLPGAAQLELVRRLAQHSSSGHRAGFEELADLVLARSGPGRGLAQLPLAWPTNPGDPRIGAPPVDPAAIPLEELVRVGVGALVDLVELTARSPAAAAPVRRRRPWSRSFRLAGAPVTAATVRASLAAAGHREGGRSPDVLVFWPGLDALMTQAWSARVQRGSALRWRAFTALWAAREDLPAGCDVARVAARWAEQVGPGRVHIVAAATDTVARRTAAEVLGLSTGRPVPGELVPLTPAAVDVVRRANRVLSLRGPAQRAALLLRLTRLLRSESDPQPLAFPARHREQAHDHAERLSAGLRGRDYAVHGDLDGIASGRWARGAATHPRQRDVLDRVLEACTRAAAETMGGKDAHDDPRAG